MLAQLRTALERHPHDPGLQAVRRDLAQDPLMEAAFRQGLTHWISAVGEDAVRQDGAVRPLLHPDPRRGTVECRIVEEAPYTLREAGCTRLTLVLREARRPGPSARPPPPAPARAPPHRGPDPGTLTGAPPAFRSPTAPRSVPRPRRRVGPRRAAVAGRGEGACRRGCPPAACGENAGQGSERQSVAPRTDTPVAHPTHPPTAGATATTHPQTQAAAGTQGRCARTPHRPAGGHDGPRCDEGRGNCANAPHRPVGENETAAGTRGAGGTARKGAPVAGNRQGNVPR
ncbi:hypothetical protein GCM10020256_08030 [Streptomyces thermocoprophilus]